MERAFYETNWKIHRNSFWRTGRTFKSNKLISKWLLLLIYHQKSVLWPVLACFVIIIQFIFHLARLHAILFKNTIYSTSWKVRDYINIYTCLSFFDKWQVTYVFDNKMTVNSWRKTLKYLVCGIAYFKFKIKNQNKEGSLNCYHQIKVSDVTFILKFKYNWQK